MKKLVPFIFILAFTLACNKDELEVSNPNDPTFDALETESGLTQLASGVYANNVILGNFFYNFHWITMAHHENMADAIYTSAGNWSFRWANQPTAITLDDGTVVTPPQEGEQGAALEARNVRTQGDLNAFAHEWMTMYKTNNVANLILQLVDTVELTGDTALKQSILKAWAYFWKGYTYSRIGSMYESGLIVSEPNATNSDYVSSQRMIEEANTNFDLAIQELNRVDGDISSFLATIIPDHLAASSFRGNSPSPVLTSDMWIRNMNTYKARNILVNTKVDEMTATQWQEISSLTENGMQANDFIFVMKQDGNNYVTSDLVPHRLFIGWHFLSERLVQDFKPDDARFTDNVIVLAAPDVNRGGRGIQYGTRWEFVQGDYASTADGRSNIYYGPTYAENELMKAEALLYSGQLEDGLSIIDAIRTHQNAELPAVAGNGMSEAEALEELRRERRIGLLLRGVGFYDARRWGVTEPVSQGGGRTGATVLDAFGNLNTNATFDYNYLDYWPVPAQELEFNAPDNGGRNTNRFTGAPE